MAFLVALMWGQISYYTAELTFTTLNRVPRVHFFCPIFIKGGPGSSVGIETGYGLDGPEMESQWGRDFPHLSRLALGPNQASV